MKSRNIQNQQQQQGDDDTEKEDLEEAWTRVIQRRVDSLVAMRMRDLHEVGGYEITQRQRIANNVEFWVTPVLVKKVVTIPIMLPKAAPVHFNRIAFLITQSLLTIHNLHVVTQDVKKEYCWSA